MKKFLLLLPLLVGCANVNQTMMGLDPTPPVTAAETPYVSKVISRGTDGINEWYCTDTDANPNLVWIECKFRNTWYPNVAGNSTNDSCIRVRFYEAKTMLKVVESRQICSGPLKARQESTRYVAFEYMPSTDAKPTHRMSQISILNVCGTNFSKCVMLTARFDE